MKSIEELKANILIYKKEVDNRRAKLAIDRELLQIAIDNFNRAKEYLKLARLMEDLKW